MGSRFGATCLCAAALLAAGALGCAEDSSGVGETAARIGRQLNPVSSFETRVMSSVPRGPYREARLLGTDLDLTMVFPATEVCDRILAPEAPVTWQRSGNFGSARANDERCDAIGVASLAAWRDRRSRRARGGAFPRDTARFSEIYRDADVVLLRGRFPLAGMVSIPGGFDLVAFVPNTEACQAPIERGSAALEFRDSGPVPFRLGAREATCPIVALAQPVRGASAPTGE